MDTRGESSQPLLPISEPVKPGLSLTALSVYRQHRTLKSHPKQLFSASQLENLSASPAPTPRVSRAERRKFTLQQRLERKQR